MPFRDGGWDTTGDGQTLSELLFVQWRFARECGFTPLMHLPAFFRGLFTVANVARQIACGIDPLAEGVRDLRLLNGLAHFSKLISQRQFSEQMDRYTTVMMGLPQTFDEALTSASEGHTRFDTGASDARRGAGNSSTIIAAFLLVLASFALLSRYLTAPVAGGWANRIFAIAFVVFGLILLRALGRAG
jgi:hypothetical protein